MMKLRSSNRRRSCILKRQPKKAPLKAKEVKTQHNKNRRSLEQACQENSISKNESLEIKKNASRKSGSFAKNSKKVSPKSATSQDFMDVSEDSVGESCCSSSLGLMNSVNTASFKKTKANQLKDVTSTPMPQDLRKNTQSLRNVFDVSCPSIRAATKQKRRSFGKAKRVSKSSLVDSCIGTTKKELHRFEEPSTSLLLSKSSTKNTKDCTKGNEDLLKTYLSGAWTSVKSKRTPFVNKSSVLEDLTSQDFDPNKTEISLLRKRKKLYSGKANNVFTNSPFPSLDCIPESKKQSKLNRTNVSPVKFVNQSKGNRTLVLPPTYIPKSKRSKVDKAMDTPPKNVPAKYALKRSKIDKAINTPPKNAPTTSKQNITSTQSQTPIPGPDFIPKSILRTANGGKSSTLRSKGKGVRINHVVDYSTNKRTQDQNQGNADENFLKTRDKRLKSTNIDLDGSYIVEGDHHEATNHSLPNSHGEKEILHEADQLAQKESVDQSISTNCAERNEISEKMMLSSQNEECPEITKTDLSEQMVENMVTHVVVSAAKENDILYEKVVVKDEVQNKTLSSKTPKKPARKKKVLHSKQNYVFDMEAGDDDEPEVSKGTGTTCNRTIMESALHVFN